MSIDSRLIIGPPSFANGSKSSDGYDTTAIVAGEKRNEKVERSDYEKKEKNIPENTSDDPTLASQKKKKVEQELRRSPIDKKELEKQAQELQNAMGNMGWYLSISRDPELGKMIIQLHNKDDGELIRQIPSEEMVELYRKYKELESENGNTTHHKIGFFFDELI